MILILGGGLVQLATVKFGGVLSIEGTKQGTGKRSQYLRF